MLTNRSKKFLVYAVVGGSIPVALAAHDHASGSYEIDATSWSTVLGGDYTTDSETVTVHIPEGAIVPSADIYLLADTTGSMGGPIGSVRTAATTLVGTLYGLPGVDVQIGVGNYKDFPYDGYAFDHQLAPTAASGSATVTSAINTWSATGGADLPEGQFFALDRLAHDVDPAGGSIGWRSDAKKIIVWFGDAPAHDTVCQAIMGLLSPGYDITQGTVTADLVAGNFTVVAISTNTSVGLNADPDAYSYDYNSTCGASAGAAGQGSAIATATGGSYISSVSSSTIVSTITSLVTTAVGTLDEVTLEPSSAVAPYITSVTDTTTGGCINIDTAIATDCTFDVVAESECVDGGDEIIGTLDAKADGSTVVQQDVTITIEDCCDAPEVMGYDVELWPPNHKYESFSLSDCADVITEECDGSPIDVDASGTIIRITSDELEDFVGNGDGRTLADMVITGSSTFDLRVEREGTGDGRVYTVWFDVQNQSGDSTEASCTFSVPHDQSGAAAVDSGSVYSVW